MSKKLIIIIIGVLVLAALVIGGYFLLKNKKSGNIFENIGDATQKMLNETAKGTLPSFSANPLENKPDINPASAGNPIKNIKTNPFE